MPILDDIDIAAKSEERTRFRLKSAGTKLNQHELRCLETLAKRRAIRPGELIRQLILDELARDSGEQTASAELTEIIGLRLLLTNVLRPISTGQKITPEVFDGILTEIKKRKKAVAIEVRQEAEGAR
ncbi:MAG: hypothetical protein ABI209_01780 [Edaphobacter sp.]